MLGWGLALAFLGLVLLAPVHPSATAEYFSPFENGAASGIAVVLATLLFVPNMAVAVLFPSMHACLSASGNVAGIGVNICFLDYTQFPTSRGFGAPGLAGGFQGFDLPAPPAGYFLFILVPLIAVILGGMLAARRGGALSRLEAVGQGAAAGVVFALLALLMLILARFRVEVAGSVGNVFRGSVQGTIGVELVRGTLLALAWGVVGGALGGLLQGRTLAIRRRQADATLA